MVIQSKAIEKFFTVVLFIMLHKVTLKKIPKCEHSNESCWAVLSCGAAYYSHYIVQQFCCNFSVNFYTLKYTSPPWKEFKAIKAPKHKLSSNFFLRKKMLQDQKVDHAWFVCFQDHVARLC